MKFDPSKYKIYKFNKYLTYEDMKVLKQLLLEQYNVVSFSIHINGHQYKQIIMKNTSIVYVTDIGDIKEHTSVVISPDRIAFILKQKRFVFDFKLNTTVQLRIGHKRYNNLIIIARFY